MKLRFFSITGLIAVVLAGLAVWRLADHDLDGRNSESFTFTVAGDVVAGTVWLPDGEPIAAIVLVHGDGPQDRTSAGGYAPLINVLLDSGIVVASWDKPGIGRSAGNWLQQSMADRAAETRAALAELNLRFDGMSVGAVGFSQAGWVLPLLTTNDAGFLVLVGPAVSWQEQGDYYTRTRLELEGVDEDTIAQILEDQNDADERVFGTDAQPSDRPDEMLVDRWRFIRTNRDADARPALEQLDVPLFAIWGEEDLNVNAIGDAAIYRQVLVDRNAETQIILWPEATHGLLKADAYNWQLTEQWSWFATLRFLAEGRHAFSPGSLEAITQWIEVQAQNSDLDE